MLTLSRTEIGEVAEGSGGGSSAMPHKANPVRATLDRRRRPPRPALAATLYASLAAEDERPAGAWHAEWEPLRDLLRLVGGAARDAAELAEGLQVHADAMREHLGTHPRVDRLRAPGRRARAPARAGPREGPAHRARRGAPAPRAGRWPGLLADEPELKGVDLADLTDPTRYTGSAGALTDRALERR